MLEKKILLRGPYDIYYVPYISIKNQNKALKIYVDTKYTYYNKKQLTEMSEYFCVLTSLFHAFLASDDVMVWACVSLALCTSHPGFFV